MKYCTKCGKEMLDEAVICPSCGCAVDGAIIPQKGADTVSVGLCVLGALIPIFGVVYWALKYKETPKKAKAVGITAVVAWAISFLISLSSISTLLSLL